MRRINSRKPSGLTAAGLRNWGMIFTAIGIIGRSIIGYQLVPLYEGTSYELLCLTIAVILMALGTIAAPIFTFLIVEGVNHTSSFRDYFLRVAGLALLCEVPYDLAMSGKFFNFDDNNPVFSLVICFVMLFTYRYYSGRSIKNTFIKFAVTAASVFWSLALNLEAGMCCVLVCSTLWGLRKKPMIRNLIGCAVATFSTIGKSFNLHYLFSPMGFFFINSYNGEKGEGNRIVAYFAYPALLCLAIGARYFLF